MLFIVIGRTGYILVGVLLVYFAATVITDRAKELGTPMIIMGTHGRSGFRRFLLGSVSERVVRTATTPVLTVHLPEA